MIKLTNFDISEFDCKCCGENLMYEDFLVSIDRAREMSQIPFTITSGYRCPEHNRDVGGSPTSSHTRGLGVDIACIDSTSRFKIIDALLANGLSRIGISKAGAFIHVDADEEKVQEVLWLY